MEVYNVRYTDASYSYAESLGTVSLPVQEAFGQVRRNGNDIIVSFIWKRGEVEFAEINKDVNIIKGIVIPGAALLSAQGTNIPDKLKDVEIGMSVAVTWRDVIYVANNPVYESSIMRSKGDVYKVEKDYVVLKDPETMRVSPSPARKHPDRDPRFYVIPSRLIVDIEVKL